jgi:hypothetical protein
LRDRTRVVAAGRIVWPLQIIAATENGGAVRCVTRSDQAAAWKMKWKMNMNVARAMIRCWHAGRVAVGRAG